MYFLSGMHLGHSPYYYSPYEYFVLSQKPIELLLISRSQSRNWCLGSIQSIQVLFLLLFSLLSTVFSWLGLELLGSYFLVIYFLLFQFHFFL